MLSLVSPNNDKIRNYYTLRKEKLCPLFSLMIFCSESDFLHTYTLKKIAKFAAMGHGPCSHPLNPALALMFNFSREFFTEYTSRLVLVEFTNTSFFQKLHSCALSAYAQYFMKCRVVRFRKHGNKVGPLLFCCTTQKRRKRHFKCFGNNVP